MNCCSSVRSVVEQHTLVGMWSQLFTTLVPLVQSVEVRLESVDKFSPLLRRRCLDVCIELFVVTNAPFFCQGNQVTKLFRNLRFVHLEWVGIPRCDFHKT